ncbi:MAG: hypothetical protein ACREIV_02905, partial [Planctomycetaceae bacterium]
MNSITDDRGCSQSAGTLLVFADDWGRHPSSCQHLISQLLSRYRVTWVNTIGMRPPRLNWSTLKRGAEKLSHWSEARRPHPALPGGLSVLKPVMWPWFRTLRDRARNRRLLARQLGRWRASVEGPVTAITTIPIVADLMDHSLADRWIYYCVDDFSQWPGVDQQAMVAMERDVVARADVVVAAGRTLQRRLESARDDVALLTHGVDLSNWTQTCGVDHHECAIASAERPLIVFWGLIDRRMDVEFLQRLGETQPRGTVALVGPESNPDPALCSTRRLRRFPAVPYEHLPAVAREADVLIMPYADLPVT